MKDAIIERMLSQPLGLGGPLLSSRGRWKRHNPVHQVLAQLEFRHRSGLKRLLQYRSYLISIRLGPQIRRHQQNGAAKRGRTGNHRYTPQKVSTSELRVRH
jgi:hypothetical protein